MSKFEDKFKNVEPDAGCHTECECAGTDKTFCERFQHQVSPTIQQRCRSNQLWRNQYCRFFSKLYGVRTHESTPEDIAAFEQRRKDAEKRDEEAAISVETMDQVIAEVKEAGIERVSDLDKMEGAGDLVHEILKKVGITSERLESWLGIECGCSARQKLLNKMLPFTKKTK